MTRRPTDLLAACLLGAGLTMGGMLVLLLEASTHPTWFSGAVAVFAGAVAFVAIGAFGSGVP